MPRIRKKTSKRVNTHQREKIKHKVSQHHKKSKKQARKDKAAGKITQKKSKKDPGIPNNFPYKDQILAEVAEQRREAAAEKQRRKDEKRAAAAGIDVKDLETTQNADYIDVDANDGQGFDGIMSLRQAPASSVLSSKNSTEKQRMPAVPVSPGPSTLRDALQKADVLLHIVDARDPEAGISEGLMKEATGKAILLLVNKADTVPRESLAQWLVHLRSTYDVLPFRVSTAFMPSPTPFEPPTKKAKTGYADDAWGRAAVWTRLENFAKTKESDELVVAVTGVTNCGKSAVINSLLGVEAMSIYNVHSSTAKRPYTTMTAQEVVASIPGDEGRKVRFVDTPGLQYVRQEVSNEADMEEMRARDIMLKCRGRIDRLKDPLFAVSHVVSRADTQDLMLAYNLPAFAEGDPNGFLAGMARVSGLIKKRGVLDHAGAARIMLRDWSTGKFVRYTVPRGATTSSSPDAADEEILLRLRNRKEMRKAGDVKLVKLQAGAADKRDVEMEEPWEEDGNRAEEDEDDGDEDQEEEDENEKDGDEAASSEGEGATGSVGEESGGEDEEGEDSEEAPELLPPASKRKRTVSFAAPAVNGKRRRGVSGLGQDGRKGRR
ncbi:P-loop containing nucleoside triphosphate hydrolase protein [Phlebopus sp. FC_14]|nr:P-loop containing nucleoside triphosphate hydrolase protein [Phlebopus sp. FC_14]